MKKIYIPRPIDTKLASSWILRHLDMAKVNTVSVSNTILHGTCFVIAPADLANDRLNDFRHGGVTEQGELFQMDGCVMMPVNTTSCHLSTLIKDKLIKELRLSTCYAHDPLRNDVLDSLTAMDGEYILMSGELFFKSNLNISINSLSDFIGVNTLSWHSLMLCPKREAQNYNNITEMALDSDCIITGVYDGESYLVWTRGENRGQQLS